MESSILFTPSPTGRSDVDKPLCVVCNRRVAQFLRDNEHATYKLCKPCNALLRAEKSWKKFGLRQPLAQWIPNDKFIKTYNQLARQGLFLNEIAEKMGLAEQSVRNRKNKLAREGVPMEKSGGITMRRKKPSEPVDRSTRNASTNEHGGGKCGMSGCDCEPCLERRREYRRQWNRDHPDKIRSYNKKSEAARKAARQVRKNKPS